MSDETLRRVRELIDAQFVDPLNLDAMARAAHFSRFHFLRAFQKEFRETPYQYLRRKRIERAKELLAESEYSITEICFAVGFESLGSFSTLFHKVVGWSPSIYRARVWEQRRNPRKFIPSCYVIQFGLDGCLPAVHQSGSDRAIRE
jgi:AraC-like DNA-binding protein